MTKKSFERFVKNQEMIYEDNVKALIDKMKSILEKLGVDASSFTINILKNGNLGIVGDKVEIEKLIDKINKNKSGFTVAKTMELANPNRKLVSLSF